MNQTVSNPDLWNKLLNFQIDLPDAELPFSKRLARDNQWTHAFAIEVVEEYKRFLYLAAVSGHSVTPSEEVDAAWHLHLCYTRSYWEELCKDILGTAMHHNPTQGGLSQTTLFRDQYAKTLESYQREFGTPAPEAIWPSIEERFRTQTSHKTSTDLYSFSISKNWLHVGVASLLASLFAVGCSEEFMKNGESGQNALLVVFAAFLLFLVLKGLFSPRKTGRKRRGRRGKKGDGGQGCGTGCDSACDSGCSSGCGGGCGGD